MNPKHPKCRVCGVRSAKVNAIRVDVGAFVDASATRTPIPASTTTSTNTWRSRPFKRYLWVDYDLCLKHRNGLLAAIRGATKRAGK